jgi:orotate phosphoribosyltransferase
MHRPYSREGRAGTSWDRVIEVRTLANKVIGSNSAEAILRQVDAIQEGHFLLTSGLHSDHYVQCQRVMQYPRHGKALARQIVDQLKERNIAPDAVVGPALGAVHWELFIAEVLDDDYALAKSPRLVKAIFAERVTDDTGDANSFTIRRGVELQPGDEVLIVEDVTTTGGSVKRVIDSVKNLGAIPVAVAAIVDRSGDKVDFGLPFFKLITLNLQTFERTSCPLCKSGSPAIKPGSSKNKSK